MSRSCSCSVHGRNTCAWELHAWGTHACVLAYVYMKGKYWGVPIHASSCSTSFVSSYILFKQYTLGH